MKNNNNIQSACLPATHASIHLTIHPFDLYSCPSQNMTQMVQCIMHSSFHPKCHIFGSNMCLYFPCVKCKHLHWTSTPHFYKACSWYYWRSNISFANTFICFFIIKFRHLSSHSQSGWKLVVQLAVHVQYVYLLLVESSIGYWLSQIHVVSFITE